VLEAPCRQGGGLCFLPGCSTLHGSGTAASSLTSVEEDRNQGCAASRGRTRRAEWKGHSGEFPPTLLLGGAGHGSFRSQKVSTVGRRLFVGNLPYEVGETELEELFGRVGQVDSVRVMRDMATGRARGFAFVEMANPDDAQRAIDELNQSQLGGRTLAVNEARPKPPSPGGGGFGSGGGGGRPGRGGGHGGGGRRREPRW
jgi:cold-inducible RNA-binding protein